MLYRRLIAIILIAMVLLVVGRFDMREPDDLAFVAGVGVDMGEDEQLHFTFQFVNPLNIGAGGEMGGSEGALRIVETDSRTFFDAVNKVHNFLSKRVSFGQTKLVLFSEQVATKGLSSYINDFALVNDFNLNSYGAVSKGSAGEYLKKIDPPLESNPIKHYEMIFRRGYSGRIESSTLSDLYFDISSKEGEGAVTYIIPQEDVEATPYKDESGIQSAQFDTVYFNEDKMAGSLDANENRLYYMLKGKLWTSYFQFEDVLEKGDKVTVTFIQRLPIKCKINTDSDRPQVSISIPLTAKILDSTRGYNETSMKEGIEKQLAETTRSFLLKTSSEYGLDILGLGAYAKRNFLTWSEFTNYNWKEKYKSADFDVKVSLKLESTGALY